MKFDSIQLLEGSKLTNVVIDSGTSFPSNPDVGELFFKTTDNLLYAYNGTNWVTSSGSGSVTSLDISGGNTGLTTSGGPITSTGTITLGGTLAIAAGGTGQTTASGAINALLPAQTGNNGKVLKTDGTSVSWATTTNGTVTSVDISGGTTGLSVSGGPVTSSGTLTLGGTLAISAGGTGQTTASGAINALVPSQTGNSGKVLKTDGTSVSWTTAVSSLAGTTNQITVSGSTGDVTVSLPSSVTISGTFSGAAVSVASIGEFAAASLVTSTTAANQVVDTAAVSVYRALKYNVTITSGSSYQFTEIYLMQDGSTVYINQVATMKSGVNLATFDADISGGNLRLLVTPVNAVSTIKALRTAVKI